MEPMNQKRDVLRSVENTREAGQEVGAMRGMRTADRADRGAIAIIGMSARFPGASSIEAFWRNLCDGVESRQVYTDDELKADGVNDATMRHPKHVRSGFVLDDIDKFDAAFFGINPREAEILDPQHRLFLETRVERARQRGLRLQHLRRRGRHFRRLHGQRISQRQRPEKRRRLEARSGYARPSSAACPTTWSRASPTS